MNKFLTSKRLCENPPLFKKKKNSRRVGIPDQSKKNIRPLEFPLLDPQNVKYIIDGLGYLRTRSCPNYKSQHRTEPYHEPREGFQERGTGTWTTVGR